MSPTERFALRLIRDALVDQAERAEKAAAEWVAEGNAEEAAHARGRSTGLASARNLLNDLLEAARQDEP
jgi:hypothetical protein